MWQIADNKWNFFKNAELKNDLLELTDIHYSVWVKLSNEDVSINR